MIDITKLCNQFDRYSHAQSQATAFTEMLDKFLLPFKLCTTQEESEAQTQQIITCPRKDTLAPLLQMLGELSEGFNDPLGELYMRKISKGHMGQYFTPQHVCDLMAQLSVGISGNGKTVLDPACGSGRMLLAAAKINRHLLFYGADLDATCCKMAVANMLLQSLTGEIAHMNSLSNEFFTGYRISTTLYNGYYFPWYKEITKPEESSIWMRPMSQPEKPFAETTIMFPQGAYQQGNLFA